MAKVKKPPITSKDKARKKAVKEGRKVLWKDERGSWQRATNRQNTPLWAVETEDIQ